MLNRRIRFIGIYRTLIFVPFVVSAAAQGVLFSFMLDPQFGIANAVLDAIGLPRQQFLQDPNQALFVLVAIGLWSGVGFCVIVYLAALQDIPRDLVEAARIDGAKRWGVLWNIVLPHLRPVTVFLVVWQAIQALQLFDLVFVTTKGGPLDATTTVVFFVWQEAFLFFKAGMGAAAAYILGLGLLALGVAQVLVRRARERRA
jgi:multiple sugar transport system permease protein